MPLKSILFITFLVFVSTAQPPKGECPHGQKKEHRGLLKELNLTEEQKEQLKPLREEKRETKRENFQKIKAMRNKIKEEMKKDEPDERTLNQYADEMGDLHEEMMKNEFAHLLKVKKVLTPEQFNKLIKHEWRKPGFRHKGKGRGGKCPRGDHKRSDDNDGGEEPL